MQYLEVSVRQ